MKGLGWCILVLFEVGYEEKMECLSERGDKGYKSHYVQNTDLLNEDFELFLC